MKKNIICGIAISVLVVAAVSGIVIMKYIHDNDPVNIPDSNIHMNVIMGEIVEITEDGIIIKITKERGGYRIHDEVCLKYDMYHEIDAIDGALEESAPEVGDVVSAQFWDEQVDQKEGTDWIEVDEVDHYLNLE